MASETTVNILIVDDQPGKLLTYEAILADIDATLIKATTAEEALAALLRNEIAVILMDVCMPDLDGFELAAMIRDHPRHEKTAVIFISAVRIDTDDLLKGYRTGAVDYVSVPVVPEILRAKVQIFVELFRKTRQLDALNAELEGRVCQRTEQLEDSHDKLRQSEERLRLASEAARLATFEYDEAERTLHWSTNINDVVHLDIPERQSFDEFIGTVYPDDRDTALSYFHAANFSDQTSELEFRVFGARGITWVLARARAFQTDTGIARVIGTLLDITERKSADSHQQLLMAELDHRVKNILANVAAIARLSSSNAVSISAFASALDGRIHAMSNAHDLLRQSSWTGVDLHELVKGALEPFRTHTSNDVIIEGDKIRLTSKFAQSMALVLHELVTNAVKHGALSRSNGRVSVNWSRIPADNENGEKIQFAWSESGGPPCVKPIRNGFGLTVIRSAASECGGQAKMNLAPEGFEFSFEGALSTRTQMVGTRHVAILPKARKPEVIAEGEPTGARILLVEDEVLIALQLKIDLEADGHVVIGPYGQLSDALRAADEADIDLALVDINLGADNSAPIAEILDRRMIPFAFTTGYNDLIFLPPQLRSYPHLTKPYSPADIKGLVARLQDQAARQAREVHKEANQVA
ncbi:histidine kinase [Hyphomicrobium methylovorum]|uniref:HWE histidine kinase domain-containing protein n=1 Tax=Hyphomicrobium methylovorum TaxID=84 RepID=UPI0015E76DDD|nr:histidine kinase [Hyphomicrobium methylovorum]